MLVVEEADVLVHIEDVLVSQAFYILGQRDAFLEVLVLSIVMNRIVDNDAIDVCVVVGGNDRFFNMILFYIG